MTAAKTKSHRIEQRSLKTGIVASGVMALAGLLVHVLSGSYALLLDGLYSGMMVGSGLIAARISRNVARPPDRFYPYGYDGQEALYVMFRSLVLIGILASAAMAALGTVIAYCNGQPMQTVHLAPVAWYSASMVIICFWLAWRHQQDWQQSGRCSELLLSESRCARIDGLISGFSGLALLIAPMLSTTPLAPLIPIGDSLIVLLMSALMVREPFLTFLTALRQTAGESAESEIIRDTEIALEELLTGLSCLLLEVTVMQVGRTSFVVVYLNPMQPMVGSDVDLIRQKIDTRCRKLLKSDVRSEVILTATQPFQN